MNFPEYQVPPCPCPNCGYKMDFASNTTGDGKPEEDDFSVCIKCVAILRYNAPDRPSGTAGLRDLSLRIASFKEVPRKLRPSIAKIQIAIAATKKRFDNQKN